MVLFRPFLIILNFDGVVGGYLPEFRYFCSVYLPIHAKENEPDNFCMCIQCLKYQNR